MKIAERFVFAKGSGGINRTIWGMQGLYIRVHQVILDWGVGVYNTIQLSYLWGATVASLGRSSALKRMQGLSYACTRCCSSGMVVPTGCYWVALILGAARVLRATPASAFHARFTRPGGSLRNLFIHNFNCQFCCTAISFPTLFLLIIRSFSENQTCQSD